MRTIDTVDYTDGTPLTVTVADHATGFLVIRQARKTWRCEASDREQHPVGCSKCIGKGRNYLEYLGEAAAYESGKRYCRRCGVHTWKNYLDIVRGETPPAPDPAAAALQRLGQEIGRAFG
jgi:hypothetical protein